MGDLRDTTVKYLVGDVFDVMANLPDASVDLILTSPPFLALRSYLPADHPDKGKEIGSEATPAEYIDVLLRLTAEWRRLLAPHGSLVVELGDTFSVNPLLTVQRVGGSGWPLAKSLTLIPESYRFALAYGINPHTGTTSPAGQWRIRNVIRWVRPNPPVGALSDKFRCGTTELVVACTSKTRYFDLDAVREPYAEVTLKNHNFGGSQGPKMAGRGKGGMNVALTHAGAPPLDWWKISPQGYAGAHYAVWPSELCVKPIKAMCPEKVCRTCGEPSRRITEPTETYAAALGQGFNDHAADAEQGQMQSVRDSERGTERRNRLRDVLGADLVADRLTTGWSDCGHDDYRPGLVLDPFAGTGTTLAVAHGHGRDAIGIDIDEKSADLARDRVGPLFLEVTDQEVAKQ